MRDFYELLKLEALELHHTLVFVISLPICRLRVKPKKEIVDILLGPGIFLFFRPKIVYGLVHFLFVYFSPTLRLKFQLETQVKRAY